MLLRLHVGRLDDGVPCVVVVGSEDDVAAGAALLQGRMNRAACRRLHDRGGHDRRNDRPAPAANSNLHE